MVKNRYDVIVAGGGHNGLVAACYLARAGFSVCILERYREVGGAAFTQEIHPGFLLSEGSYVLSLMPRKILAELGAWDGIELIKRNPRFFMPFPDGQSLTAWEEQERFLEEIAKFSRKDAVNYPRYDAFVEKASEVMDKFILCNPPSFAEFAAEFGTADEARIFQKMILGSAPRGLVVIKDFTSILSMNRDLRTSVLAALREVYDGRWDRNVGTDGGKTLTWTGRIVVIGAVTSAYDAAHAVIAQMGERFCLVRMDSSVGRRSAGRQALSNVDHEDAMKAELADVVGAVLAGADDTRAVLTDRHEETLLELADLVTLARTAVERDYKGDVIDAHQPEMPTRFAKMLGQIVRGGLAIGMPPNRALRTAIRSAGDSVPPLRLAALADIARYPGSRLADVRVRLQKPRSTVDRELQALHILGLLLQHDSPGGWQYYLAETVDGRVLAELVTRNVSTAQDVSPRPKDIATDISGYGKPPF